MSRPLAKNSLGKLGFFVDRSVNDRTDDQELIRRLAGGDEAAFELLYRRHRAYVLRLARRFTDQEADAAEVVQDVFLWLVRRVETLELRARFQTLIYPVVKSRARDLRRRDQRRREFSATDLSPDDGGEGGSDAVIEQFPAPLQAPESEVGEGLASVLGSLSASQREIVLLRFLDGFSLKEIAETQGLAVGTVKSRLHYALERLRESPATARFFEKSENSNPPGNSGPEGRS